MKVLAVPVQRSLLSAAPGFPVSLDSTTSHQTVPVTHIGIILGFSRCSPGPSLICSASSPSPTLAAPSKES